MSAIIPVVFPSNLSRAALNGVVRFIMMCDAICLLRANWRLIFDVFVRFGFVRSGRKCL